MWSKLVPCPTCGQEISRKAPTCPHCGEDFRPRPAGCLITLCVLGVAAIFVYAYWEGQGVFRVSGTPSPEFAEGQRVFLESGTNSRGQTGDVLVCETEAIYDQTWGALRDGDTKSAALRALAGGVFIVGTHTPAVVVSRHWFRGRSRVRIAEGPQVDRVGWVPDFCLK